VLISKSLRRDGYNSGQHSWAPTKTGRAHVVPAMLAMYDAVVVSVVVEVGIH
jgi:integrase